MTNSLNDFQRNLVRFRYSRFNKEYKPFFPLRRLGVETPQPEPTEAEAFQAWAMATGHHENSPLDFPESDLHAQFRDLNHFSRLQNPEGGLDLQPRTTRDPEDSQEQRGEMPMEQSQEHPALSEPKTAPVATTQSFNRLLMEKIKKYFPQIKIKDIAKNAYCALEEEKQSLFEKLNPPKQFVIPDWKDPNFVDHYTRAEDNTMQRTIPDFCYEAPTTPNLPRKLEAPNKWPLYQVAEEGGKGNFNLDVDFKTPQSFLEFGKKMKREGKENKIAIPGNFFRTDESPSTPYGFVIVKGRLLTSPNSKGEFPHKQAANKNPEVDARYKYEYFHKRGYVGQLKDGTIVTGQGASFDLLNSKNWRAQVRNFESAIGGLGYIDGDVNSEAGLEKEASEQGLWGQLNHGQKGARSAIVHAQDGRVFVFDCPGLGKDEQFGSAWALISNFRMKFPSLKVKAFLFPDAGASAGFASDEFVRNALNKPPIKGEF